MASELLIAQAMVESDIPGAEEVCIQCLKDSCMRKREMRMPLGSLPLLQMLSTATGQKRGLDQGCLVAIARERHS